MGAPRSVVANHPESQGLSYLSLASDGWARTVALFLASEAGCRGSTQRPSRRNLPRVAQRCGQPVDGDMDRLGDEERLIVGAVAAQQLELDGVERQQVGVASLQGAGLALVLGNQIRVPGDAEVDLLGCARILRR